MQMSKSKICWMIGVLRVVVVVVVFRDTMMDASSVRFLAPLLHFHKNPVRATTTQAFHQHKFVKRDLDVVGTGRRHVSIVVVIGSIIAANDY